MSLKDLFKEDENLRSLEPTTKDDSKEEIESFDLITAVNERNKTFVATEFFATASAFARFGSAEKYYEDSIKRVYNTYPYDGSLREKVLWEVSSSLLDLYIFEKEYPRTTGYAVFSTGSLTATDMVGSHGDNEYGKYGAAGTGSYEYVYVKGGPHAGTGDELYYDPEAREIIYRKDANVYDLNENRENNLKIGGTDGNTVEFWMKKDAFDADATEKEVILDVFVSGTLSGSTEYGRLTVEMSGHGAATNTLSPFYVTYMSGTTGLMTGTIGSSITTSTVADDEWHHYAFRFKNTGSAVLVDLFVDGVHNHRIQDGTTVDYVSGALCATIGALGISPSGNMFHKTAISSGAYGPTLGWAKLSASIDEFRYWKTFRSSKKIQRYWFDQVGAGTNTDTTNTQLGVYYKFNEGITLTASTDSAVLDYSGRLSNGDWEGYSSTYSRVIGSAMIEASASKKEFKDPILYSYHPDVSEFLDYKKLVGRIHDDSNLNSIRSYIPHWMLEENDVSNPYTSDEHLGDNTLLNLLQIVSSYFDSAAVLIDKLPTLGHQKYYSTGSFPPPFTKKILESTGFIVPDIFINTNLLEDFENRNDDLLFEERLQNVKNTIYQNIYNNLTYINKSKGTEKAFRNLIRCFGIGDDTLKFNMYADNLTYKLEDNSRNASRVKNYINFNEIENGDGTIYQYKIDSNATSFISGSKHYVNDDYEGAGLAFTLESEVLLPKRVSIADYATVKAAFSGAVKNQYPLVISASIAGMHTAISSGTTDGSGLNENELTWDTNDYGNFQIYTIKDDKFSSDAKFLLTCSNGGFFPELTSSVFEDVYDDQRWSLSVTVKPKAYPFINQVSGAADDKDYILQFYGVNHISDIKHQSFLVTSSITAAQGIKFMASPKRVYVGAHTTNFTGSTITFADSKIASCRAWFTDIGTGSVDEHNMKIGNFGPANAIKNNFLYQSSTKNTEIPELGTLALLWDFTTVTGSDANGQFSVEDETSGSSTDSRYGWFSDLVSRRHTASGSFFEASATNVAQLIRRNTMRQQVPETLNDSNLVNILSDDDVYYDINTRPTTYHFSVEKSLFQDISEEQLNMFASIKYLNNLLGNPVNVYRGQYKDLKKAADMFFEKVDNDYDFDKYVEYFKYIDYAVSKYVEKLIPASLENFKNGISTVIENFTLGDRNKFHNKFPIMKEKIPEFEAQLLGVNELLYDWEHGHAPGTFFSTKSTAFNGTNNQSLIEIADSDSLSFGADGTTGNEPAFSISAWINMTDASSFSIFCKGGSTVREYDFFTGGSDNLYWRIYDSAHTVYIAVTTFGAYGALTSLEGSWAHVVATYDGSRASSGMKLYINGSAIATADTSAGSYTAMHNTSQPAGLGRFNGVLTTSIAEGFIDEVAVFDEELSADDVTAVYNNGYTFNLNGLGYKFKNNLVSWWRMGENKTGTSPNYTIVDEIGSNNAVMSNFQNTATSAVVDKHAPSVQQADLGVETNCLWWQERAIRREGLISSGDQVVDDHRQKIHDVIINETNFDDYTLVSSGSSGKTQYSGSTYVMRRLAKPYKLSAQDVSIIHGGPNFYKNKNLGFFDAINVLSTGSSRGVIALEPVSQSLEPLSACQDDLAIINESLGKRRFSFSAESSINDNDFTIDDKYKGDRIFPFSLYSSSLSSSHGYRGTLSKLRDNLDITNLHHDVFAPHNEIPMQGPFTEKFVGGRPHRHVNTNFSRPEDHLDNKVTRLEGWTLEIDTTTGNKLELYNAAKRVSSTTIAPETGSSYYFRDERVKRPVNIRNIQMTTGAAHDSPDPRRPDQAYDVTNIGNYQHDYDIIQTSERSINNRYFTETGGITGSTNSIEILSGVLDYEVPSRSITGSNKFVFVNRFSSPGGPETAAASALDIEAGETSPYNALPFRNLTVRTALNELYSDHCKQYGYFSDHFNSASYTARSWPSHTAAEQKYTDTSGSVNEFWYYAHAAVTSPAIAAYTTATASFHKTNRNSIKTIKYAANVQTGSGIALGPVDYVTSSKRRDNFFVQRVIPQTDLQYAWITASMIHAYSSSALFQYQQKDLSKSDFASSDITFASSSDYGSYVYTSDNKRYFGSSGPYNTSPAATLPTTFTPIDFVGLNTNIVEPITSSENTLGWPALSCSNPAENTVEINYVNLTYNYLASAGTVVDNGLAATLNSILLNRQGPYGGANWKLYRKDNHPIVRHQRKNNILGGLVDPLWSLGGWGEIMGHDIVNYVEPPISSKYNPLNFVITTTPTPGSSISTEALVTLGNRLVHSTDHTSYPDLANLDTLIFINQPHMQQATYDSYTSFKELVKFSPGGAAANVSYVETIWPKEQYTYLSGSRLRTEYKNTFWRTERLDRDASDLSSSCFNIVEDTTIASASIWKLDAHKYFATTASFIPVTGSNTNPRIPTSDGGSTLPTFLPDDDGCGELQSAWSLFHYGDTANIVAGCNYSRRTHLISIQEFLTSSNAVPPAANVYEKLGSSFIVSTEFSKSAEDWDGAGEGVSFFANNGGADLTASPTSRYLRYSAAAGDTFWEVTASNNAGIAPFYDSYSEYAEEGFRILKEGAILPEFRISERIEDFHYTNTLPALGDKYDPTLFLYPSDKRYDEPKRKAMTKLKSGILSLTGSVYDKSFSGSWGDTGIPRGQGGDIDQSWVDDFLNRHAYSDFYKHFSLIKKDYNDNRTIDSAYEELKAAGGGAGGSNDSLSTVEKIGLKTPRLEIACEAMIKFLPYEGFYPAERTVQLGAIFSKSVNETNGGPLLEGSEANFRTAMKPFFAPGILYNSIKSGIAVDYPIYTDTLKSPTAEQPGVKRGEARTGSTGAGVCVPSDKVNSGSFNNRIPFDFVVSGKSIQGMQDAEPNTNCHIQSTASWGKIDARYQFAMENFLAETVYTFLEGQQVSYISSGPIPTTITVKEDGTYLMDIVLRNSTTVNDPFRFHKVTASLASSRTKSSINVHDKSITMYDRAITGFKIDPHLYGSSFGPPTDAGTANNVDDVLASYEPYTPPYYDGYAYGRVSAELKKGVYETSDLIKEFKYSYKRLNTLRDDGGTAQLNGMQVSASLNFGQPSDPQNGYGIHSWAFSSGARSYFVIHPKFESPVLDFSNVTPQYSVVSGNVAKGMWHQYGEIPQNGKGIQMELFDTTLYHDKLAETEQVTDPKSLVNLLNFEPDSVNLGKLNNSAEFSEAIVAIPFKRTKGNPSETTLYNMHPKEFERVRGLFIEENFIKTGTGKLEDVAPGGGGGEIITYDTVTGQIVKVSDPTIKDYWKKMPASPPQGPGIHPFDEGIYELLDLMRRYVLPPHLDFFRFPEEINNGNPFAMFMFEFTQEIDKNDLQNIWQNIEPTFARQSRHVMTSPVQASLPVTNAQAGKSSKYVPAGPAAGTSYYKAILTPDHDYFDDIFDEKLTKWAIFKVKRRARNNYKNTVGRLKKHDSPNAAEFVRSDLNRHYDYDFSYNWPHDFYSLVELAKVNTRVTFETKDTT
tara:strand:- start:8683 stop:19083 length:10401 start_codon:yes stop_codon:yes gene_type:complete